MSCQITSGKKMTTTEKISDAFNTIASIGQDMKNQTGPNGNSDKLIEKTFEASYPDFTVTINIKFNK